MRSILILFGIFLFLSFISNVKVQAASYSLDNYSDITEIADEALKLEIKVVDQFYPSKKIKFELIIDPGIDSGRTAIDWIADETILKVEGEKRDLVDLSKGQKIVVNKSLIPQTFYTIKDINKTGIAVKVTAASYEKNYISVKKLDFEINKDFEITPLLSSYNTQKNVFHILSWVLGIIVTAVLIALIAVGAQKFIVYLNSD